MPKGLYERVSFWVCCWHLLISGLCHRFGSHPPLVFVTPVSRRSNNEVNGVGFVFSCTRKKNKIIIIKKESFANFNLGSMAVSISRRAFRSLNNALSSSIGLSNGLYSHRVVAHSVSSFESSALKKNELSFIACRRFSTSILTPGSSNEGFPSNLLSRKREITPERTAGLHQDLVIPVTNFSNEDKGLMVLAGDVFDVPIRKDIIHRVVRWQLAKRQQGTHSTKTISEVSGTGKKPYRQKGTGRARHGTLRGPQFRGGATMHGPKPRSHAIKLNKKVRRLGLKIALSARAAEGKLLVFEDLEVPSHKTKNMANYYKQMEEAKKLLLVDGDEISEKLRLATQNLHYVNVLPSKGLNVYSILLHDTLVMSRDAVNRIVDRMHTPIKR